MASSQRHATNWGRLVAVLPQFQITMTNWAALGAEPVVTVVRPRKHWQNSCDLVVHSLSLLVLFGTGKSTHRSPSLFLHYFDFNTVPKSLPVCCVVSHHHDITRSRALESTVYSDSKRGALISVGNRPLPRILVKIPNSRWFFFFFCRFKQSTIVSCSVCCTQLGRH